MFRKSVLVLAAAGLSATFMVAAVGTANAQVVNPNLPGTVACAPAHGVWNGVISFSPPLMSGGTANTEVMSVKATLGSTSNPCLGNTGIVAIGTIAGKIKLAIAGSANDCNTIFSGSAITPANAKFKMVWSTPGGASPTVWQQLPHFKLKGAASFAKLNLTLGAITGSFAPLPSPGGASFQDANWTTAVPTGCSSSTGLGSLTLSTSKGKW